MKMPGVRKEGISGLKICIKTIIYFLDKNVLGYIAIIIISGIIFIVMQMDIEMLLVRSLIIKSNDKETLISRSLKVFYFEVIGSFLQELKSYIFIPFCARHIRKLSVSVFKNIFSHDFVGQKDRENGVIQNQINIGINGLTKLLSALILNVLPVIISFVILGVKFKKDFEWKFFMLVFFSFYVSGIVNIILIYFRIKYKLVNNMSIGKGQKVLYEAFDNTDIIKTSGTEEHELKKYTERMKSLEKSYKLFKRIDKVVIFFERLIFSTLKLYVFYSYAQAEITKEVIDKILILKVLVERSERNAINIGKVFKKIYSNVMDANCIMKYLKKPEKILYKVNNAIFSKNIIIDNYQISKRQISPSRILSHEIKKGDKIAIVGSNGSGKSTLLKSILKLNDYDGSIFLDNIDIKEIRSKEYRELFSYVPQNFFLFDDTIIYNILYGTHDVKDEEVISLSKKFNLHNSICSKPDKYFTKIGENGDNLSGGERQKIILMRAVLRKSEIFILDELTSNLDPLSEDIIIDYFLSLKEKTIIASLHSTKSIQKFNNFILLESNDEIIH